MMSMVATSPPAIILVDSSSRWPRPPAPTKPITAEPRIAHSQRYTVYDTSSALASGRAPYSRAGRRPLPLASRTSVACASDDSRISAYTLASIPVYDSAIASTPAVGPRPTMRTNSSAHTSSGTERSTIRIQRRTWRTTPASGRMRPVPRREIDRRSLMTKVAGMATISASVRPAVAIATVCQVSRSTIARKAGSVSGVRKSRRKPPAARRLCASNSSHGLNSAATSSG